MSALPPALVVLAAGASARLGQPKALARLRAGAGGTALELLLAAGAELGDPRALVVTGRHHGAIAAALSARVLASVELCENERWAEGRTGSVRCAVARRPGRDLCLAPVDVPLVQGAVFAALAAEWARCGAPARGWLAPWVRRPELPDPRAFGHPVLIGRELLAALKDFPPERPLSALRALARPLLALEVAAAAILDDLDTPADRARLSGGG